MLVNWGDIEESHMSEWELICFPKDEGLKENHKEGKGSLDMSFYSQKDVTVCRGCKLKLVKFSLMKKGIVDEFLTLVDTNCGKTMMCLVSSRSQEAAYISETTWHVKHFLFSSIPCWGTRVLFTQSMLKVVILSDKVCQGVAGEPEA
ncbi:hypothetical protein Q9966_007328 [Columba livia]|nr:hypothetical protein Q9966_007328 [Columba livia]